MLNFPPSLKRLSVRILSAGGNDYSPQVASASGHLDELSKVLWLSLAVTALWHLPHPNFRSGHSRYSFGPQPRGNTRSIRPETIPSSQSQSGKHDRTVIMHIKKERIWGKKRV